MLVQSGRAAGIDKKAIEADGTSFSFLFLPSKQTPKLEVVDGMIKAGGRTIKSVEGKLILD